MNTNSHDEFTAIDAMISLQVPTARLATLGDPHSDIIVRGWRLSSMDDGSVLCIRGRDRRTAARWSEVRRIVTLDVGGTPVAGKARRAAWVAARNMLTALALLLALGQGSV